MKNVLVLGAGFVAGPLVRYFFEKPGVRVSVADIEPEKAKVLAGDHPRGRAFGLDLNNKAALAGEIAAADVVVSLVPYLFHPVVARLCLAAGKPMVTTSYVSEAMRALDAEARTAGIPLVNEVGLDPGIDHMEAMRVIDEIHARGGRVVGFRSYCGGLPAPEANTNPFGYKFSWSPRGVLLAGKNEARYLADGREIVVPAAELFAGPERVEVAGLGVFDGYPNRNSVPYRDLYGIPEARTMFRGTFRWPGWCETLKKIGEWGLLDATESDWSGSTRKAVLAKAAGLPDSADLRRELAARWNLAPDAALLDRMAWLGLFEDGPLPASSGSPLDLLERLMLAKMLYEPGERDMIILRHEFEAAYPDGSGERIFSTLIDYGVPGGDSAMARTVGLPAAAAANLVLEGRVCRPGVLIPVSADLYAPILFEIKTRGIIFREERTKSS
ncbi:MAG: saccharopine dehydrogenase NADP-binding domain-containing protein [Candidatus Aminicenantes bacterium]|nr:saccharopine dehydrogenase NADP-binding domain-containing protein [Candidatus Aminicenantes bacterium]